jgi:hypothetical protein
VVEGLTLPELSGQEKVVVASKNEMRFAPVWFCYGRAIKPPFVATFSHDLITALRSMVFATLAAASSNRYVIVRKNE